MPVSEYYKGKGERVMASMVRRYGPERGKRIFYATANKLGLVPPEKKRKLVRKKRIL